MPLGCTFVAWIFLFSLTVLSPVSQSHILTHFANCITTCPNPIVHSHIMTPGNAHWCTSLTSIEPPWFTPAEVMNLRVITPTLHSHHMCVYHHPYNRRTSMHAHTSPTSGIHKLTIITPWTSFFFTKLTNTSSICALKRCITSSTSLKQICALNLAFTVTCSNITEHLHLVLKHSFNPSE